MDRLVPQFRRRRDSGRRGDYPSFIANPQSDGPAVVAINEGGHCHVSISLRAVLAWAAKNRPDLLAEYAEPRR